MTGRTGRKPGVVDVVALGIEVTAGATVVPSSAAATWSETVCIAQWRQEHVSPPRHLQGCPFYWHSH